MRLLITALIATFFTFSVNVFAQDTAPILKAKSCSDKGVWLQVLGSGGPELQDKHASSGYLVMVDGKARALIDLGGGAAMRFGQAGANMADLDVIAFSHFHVDHSAGLPVLVKSGFFEGRKTDLPVFGPTGNDFMPTMTEFLDGLFNEDKGSFRYLEIYLKGKPDASYKLVPHDIDVKNMDVVTVFENDLLKLSAIPVKHGPLPALAWRVDVGDKSVTFSGDMNGSAHTLEKLAKDSDILVAHNAIPEGVTGFGRKLHMPPSVIGQIAKTANPSQLVLSHRMTRSFGQEKQTLSEIKKSYQGEISFAEDLDCFQP